MARLVKYCKREHNLRRGCRTIRLGTLGSYCADDPNFLRHDAEEGHYSVSKKPGVKLNEKRAAELLGARPGDVEIAEGAHVERHERFPNCLIFCVSQTTPSIDLARILDPCYNDWFEITDVASFTSRLIQLLGEQINPTDLEFPSGVSIADCVMHVGFFGGSVVYGERRVVLNHENFDEVMSPIREPLKRLVLKPRDHQSIREYRFVGVITDSDGNVINVKTQAKNVQLMSSDPILSAVGKERE